MSGATQAGPPPNTRMLAGLVGADGRRLRSGILIRGAAPVAGDLSPDGMPWPPQVVIDLRWDDELIEAHLFQETARYVRAPMPNSLEVGLRPGESLRQFYQRILERSGPSLARVVDEVGNARGAVLIHCSAGKDRTGIAIAMLLTLLAVPRELIVADYLASNAAVEVLAARLAHLPSAAYAAALPTGVFRVSEDAMTGVLDGWEGFDGGVGGWLVSHGSSEKAIRQLTDRLLEPPRPADGVAVT